MSALGKNGKKQPYLQILTLSGVNSPLRPNLGCRFLSKMGVFPRPARTALDPYSITAMGPSTFLRNLYDLDPEVVAHTLARQAASINKTVEYVLERLSINAPGFVSFFKKRGTPSPEGSER